MRIAIPVFQGRVSPVFGAAQRLKIWEVQENEINSQELLTISTVAPYMRPQWLKSQGVEVLLCGGIGQRMKMLIESCGIKVVPWVAGVVDDVLEAYLNNTVFEEQYLMPGCWRGKRRFKPGRWTGL